MIASAFEAQGFQETLKYHCLGFLSRSPCPFGFRFHSIYEQVMCQFNLSVWSEQILTKMAKDAAKLTSKYN